MKSYPSVNENINSEKFVLKYEIDGSNIIVYYASGDKIEVPYNKQNEEKLLQQMELQMKDTDGSKYLADEEKTKNIKRIINDFICILLNGICLATGTPFVVLQTILLTCNIICVPLHIEAVRYFKSIIDDIKKNDLYDDNKEELNEFVSKNKAVALKCVSSEIKDVILSTSEDEPVFTINTIDKIKLKDLQKLLKDIKRYSQFNMESIPEKTYQEKEIDSLIEKYNSDEPKKYGLSNKERTRI